MQQILISCPLPHDGSKNGYMYMNLNHSRGNNGNLGTFSAVVDRTLKAVGACVALLVGLLRGKNNFHQLANRMKLMDLPIRCNKTLRQCFIKIELNPGFPVVSESPSDASNG